MELGVVPLTVMQESCTLTMYSALRSFRNVAISCPKKFERNKSFTRPLLKRATLVPYQS